MELKIIIESEKEKDLTLMVQNDVDGEYVWLNILSKDNESSICVKIEDLKLALRKITTK